MIRSILIILSLVISCSAYATVDVEEPWIRPASKTMHSSAMYAILNNASDNDDYLYRVDSPAAEKLELHETIEQDNGVSSMQHIDRIKIPAHGQTTLKPGNIHIMFIKLTQGFQEGSIIPVQLFFSSGDIMSLEVPVKGYSSLSKDCGCGGANN